MVLENQLKTECSQTTFFTWTTFDYGCIFHVANGWLEAFVLLNAILQMTICPNNVQTHLKLH